MASTKALFEKRRQRNRTQLRKKSVGRPRLSIHRTNQHIYAQVIDDVNGKTLAAASTTEKDLRSGATSNIEAATSVGKLIAERAKAAGVETVVFDRGGFLYHGRVKALAVAARDGGLDF
ncbi:50S ribosomal protein L18 [Kordiimonas sp. SCSIO 12610]|jgi:large subunit ribosomal protein L18|uniref:50S ribosomal protein L18 n=1 Tax=Kordiimonas sp. SCSIO 12610 TaxID=2829597 RepID=UPI00210B384C|nr:50S ribosomal protein L18 [Kordiimonas sp. SCSIO 12610]UTW54310.1 50S ribosomal protein L18 [Kordiimonas sp. SCSIO 12610]